MDNHSCPIGAPEATPPTSGSSNDAWIIDIRNKMMGAPLYWRPRESPMRNSASIFRIPTSIRRQSPEHYQPKVVAIGPYHRRNDAKLKINDEEKWGLVNLFFYGHGRSLTLERWLQDMRSWEGEARNYYSEDVPMDSQSFTDMLLLDGCFLLIALEVVRVPELIEWTWTPEQIMLDVLLLENQIPFFVLVYLYYGTRTPEFGYTLPDVSHELFADTCSDAWPTVMFFYDVLFYTFTNVLPINPGQVHHLLHLFRLSLDPIKKPRSEFVEVSKIPTNISSAIKLKNHSAVKFKRNNHAEGLLDIRFHNGVIEIPPILDISDDSNAFFVNLIALEECKSDIEPCVTTYLAFLKSLMKKESDVELLERNGILLNKLPSRRDVLDFFNKSCPKAKFDSSSSYLAMIFVSVNRHHNKIWNRWYADLKLNYFSNPWATLSVMGATILLVLSFIQTYYSALGYYHK